MGERKKRLIEAIIEGQHHSVIRRHFGLTRGSLDAFKRRNGAAITHRILKRQMNG